MMAMNLKYFQEDSMWKIIHAPQKCHLNSTDNINGEFIFNIHNISQILENCDGFLTTTLLQPIKYP